VWRSGLPERPSSALSAHRAGFRFADVFDIYFINSSIKKRVVDTLSTIRLYVSYSIVYKYIKGVADIVEA